MAGGSIRAGRAGDLAGGCAAAGVVESSVGPASGVAGGCDTEIHKNVANV